MTGFSADIQGRRQLKAAFIGHFSPEASWNKEATSVPGDQVQRQIIADLQDQLGVDNVYCYSMAPEPSWPRGTFFYPRRVEQPVSGGVIIFLPYVNIALIKNLLFAVMLLFHLRKIKPSLCIQYNSYLFENLALLVTRYLDPFVFIAVILQDIYTSQSRLVTNASYWRERYEKLGLHFLKWFNLVTPVSAHIIRDFGLDDNRSIVFPGGVTNQSLKASSASYDDIDPNIAVYAGALSSYNGVDVIIREWVDQSIPYELHIFGRGPLSCYVADMAKNNSSIIFHGLQHPSLVTEFQSRAKWNFCFRFSKGIDQRYFFPSKLFGLLTYPGITLINKSFDIPASISEFTYIADDDLLDLGEDLKKSESANSEDRAGRRRDFVLGNYSWRSLIATILSRAEELDHRI